MIRSPLRRPGSGLLHDRRAVAIVEFALCVPVLLVLVLYGIELANYLIVRQRVSQLALQVADNASRIGVESVMTSVPITETQINDLLLGAKLQSAALDVERNGTIILSSLETNSGGGQWIHWQRCFGAANYPSSYGKEGDGKNGNAFKGMGRPGELVVATDKVPVMFVEVAYTYTPAISKTFAPQETVRESAALAVRDDRDLSKVYNPGNEEIAICEA
ncbi:TadE/TadG family type IV pilus assembly protein [Sphingomonas turrisvirgatae]|uniref:TadE-like domain-containing protein n=1 Tax=Sphingomonas turrisvirgatae TaxID=1888892 RepID=A0A1E3LY66_9SPHN|nr:TadE/TadG family type IV pilus assembly protein [Sphingomonas turrisvirgatae]ODP38649.1 hypothetical protein BFL28_01035 [Sphingomonas turrisvirgatae]